MNKNSTRIKPTEAKGFYVRRTRVGDTSVATGAGFRADQTGETRFTKTFRTDALAQREADAWNGTGDWSAIVVDLSTEAK